MSDDHTDRQDRARGTQRHDARPDGGRPDESDTGEALAEGETVRADVFEHAVVESEVVETDVVDRTVVEDELVSQDVGDVHLADRPDADLDVGDGRLFLGDDVSPEVVEENVELVVELDEVRTQIVEVVEEKTVESRVVADEAAEVAVSTEGVEEHVVDSELVRTPGDRRDEVDVQSELVDDDIVRSRLTERRTVERDVAEETVLTALVTDVDTGSASVTHGTPLEREVTEGAADTGTAEEPAGQSARVVDVTADDRGKILVHGGGTDPRRFNTPDFDHSSTFE